jgi:hypothetical protein
MGMLGNPNTERLAQALRMDAFRLLVVGQDCAMSIDESRQMVCARFSLPEDEVRRIEQEGLESDWPPLCDRG